VTAPSSARRQAEEALAYNRRHIATEAGVPRFWTEHETRLDSALRTLLAAHKEAEAALSEERRKREEAETRAMEFGDALDMALEKKAPDVRALRGAAFQQFWAWQEVSGHIGRGTSLYGEIEACIEEAFRLGAVAATAPAPQRSQTLTRAEAIAAGIPIPPDAVGVRIWGASVTAPAPQPDPSLLGRIEAACGIPDPAQACRTVLALCREARERGALDLRIGAPAPPAGDGVREAAERLRESLARNREGTDGDARVVGWAIRLLDALDAAERGTR
jgi:hypothetical protein